MGRPEVGQGEQLEVTAAPAPSSTAAPTVVRRPSGSGRVRLLAGAAVGPVVVLAAVIGIWYLISYVVLEPSQSFLLPTLDKVFSTSYLTHRNLMILLSALGETVEISLIGLGIAILIGMSLAVSMSEWRSAERGIYPYMVALQTIPFLALVPLIGFWLGFGISARLVIVVLMALFPIVANTFFGLRSPSKPLFDLFDLHHAGRVTKLAKLKVPLALPAVFAGFRISAGLAVNGEIAGGFFFQRGKPDLGVLIVQYQANLSGELLFGAIILSCLLGVVVFLTFGRVSTALVGRWKE